VRSMKELKLSGCGTAIITPFQADESIDESALRRLIEHQIEGGVDFLVACGTTGESVTLTETEQSRVIALTVEGYCRSCAGGCRRRRLQHARGDREDSPLHRNSESMRSSLSPLLQ
jgi:hypothetical protein